MVTRLYAPLAVEAWEATARRKAKAAQRAIDARDEAIADLRQRGLTLRRIAEVMDLPHTTVADILRRQRS